MDASVQRIMRGFRHIARELSVHSRFIKEKYQVTLPQLIALHEIHEQGPLSLGALTRELYLNNSTVTGIVDRLEKRDLVQRVRKDGDRRQVHVQMTDTGERFIRKAPIPLQEEFVREVREMAPEERNTLMDSIDKLAAMLHSASAAEREQP